MESTGRIMATASSAVQTVGMATTFASVRPAGHLRRRPLRGGPRPEIGDFRLYSLGRTARQNGWDTLLFPDNGAWRMAATPLGRHFPIVEWVAPRMPQAAATGLMRS